MTDSHQRLQTPPQEVLLRFGVDPRATCRAVVDGHINDSIVVEPPHDTGHPLLLQRINHHVFEQPNQVQENIARVTDALRTSFRDLEPHHLRRRVLELVHTTCGANLVVDDEGWTWRAYHYVPGARTQLRAERASEAHQAAQAFGEFQWQLRDFDAAQLHETIPRFHDTEHRFEQLDASITADAAGRLASVGAEVDAYLEQRRDARRLLDLQDQGVPLRTVHNDAKLSNVLLDAKSGESLCVIDLDTVMPGLSLFDFGEMVRSMGHTTPEDERDAERIFIRPEFYRAIVSGYLEEAGALLEPAERSHLFDAALVLTLENGVRFLADYIAGDVYYRVKRPDQNLDRARSHLALLASLRRQEPTLRSIDRHGC